MNRNRFIAIPAMALLAAVGGGTAAADELTLREIMVQLEADLQEMTAAIMREDFASVAAAARAIADHPEPVPPCGGCRQRLAEFAGPDIPVTMANLAGARRTMTLGALLPAAFASAVRGKA